MVLLRTVDRVSQFFWCFGAKLLEAVPVFNGKLTHTLILILPFILDYGVPAFLTG